MVKNEEYATEISPAGIPIRHKRKEIANEIEGTNTGAMVGYVALFLSLFSIAFYPVTLGSLAILVGLLAVNFEQEHLDIQQLVLVVFLFYSLYFIRLLCQRFKTHQVILGVFIHDTT